MYCFQVGLNQCDRPRCCGMRLEQIQFLIGESDVVDGGGGDGGWGWMEARGWMWGMDARGMG